jgi:hypothetical protein
MAQSTHDLSFNAFKAINNIIAQAATPTASIFRNYFPFEETKKENDFPTSPLLVMQSVGNSIKVEKETSSVDRTNRIVSPTNAPSYLSAATTSLLSSAINANDKQDAPSSPLRLRPLQTIPLLQDESVKPTSSFFKSPVDLTTSNFHGDETFVSNPNPSTSSVDIQRPHKRVDGSSSNNTIVEVNIGGKFIGELIFQRGENVHRVAEKFVSEHKLPLKFCKKLALLIESKVSPDQMAIANSSKIEDPVFPVPNSVIKSSKRSAQTRRKSSVSVVEGIGAQLFQQIQATGSIKEGDIHSWTNPVEVGLSSQRVPSQILGVVTVLVPLSHAIKNKPPAIQYSFSLRSSDSPTAVTRKIILALHIYSGIWVKFIGDVLRNILASSDSQTREFFDLYVAGETQTEDGLVIRFEKKSTAVKEEILLSPTRSSPNSPDWSKQLDSVDVKNMSFVSNNSNMDSEAENDADYNVDFSNSVSASAESTLANLTSAQRTLLLSTLHKIKPNTDDWILGSPVSSPRARVTSPHASSPRIVEERSEYSTPARDSSSFSGHYKSPTKSSVAKQKQKSPSRNSLSKEEKASSLKAERSNQPSLRVLSQKEFEESIRTSVQRGNGVHVSTETREVLLPTVKTPPLTLSKSKKKQPRLVVEDKSHKETDELMCNLEIEVENSTLLLPIHRSTDPIVAAEEFVKKHSLPVSAKRKIEQIIRTSK